MSTLCKKSELAVSIVIDETAEATVEWVLLLGCVIVPLVLFIFAVMKEVSRFYSITSWVVSLPFP